MRDLTSLSSPANHKHMRVLILLLSILFCLLCSVLYAPHPCFAEEKTTIQADALEYAEKTFTYTAKGHVKIEKGAARVEADEMTYNEQTSEVVAEGSVTYEDPAVVIKAKRAELNLEFETGVLYDGEIFSKKDNYHITGVEIEKVGVDQYTLRNASWTTCDAPVPAWCFRGKDVDLTVGEEITAKDVTFKIRDLPVLYTPYIAAPVARERKSGLLIPAVGLVSSKGLHYEQPYYIVLSENSDATLILDAYTKTGIGEGLEFRFIEPDHSKGDFWTYHLFDTQLQENLWDLKWTYENRERDEGVTGYLNLNYMSSTFYSQYYPYLSSTLRKAIDPASYQSLTTERFLESTGEVALNFASSRLYLNSQYLVDLQPGASQGIVLQRLPEIGYFLDPRPLGPLVFSLTTNVDNYWRSQGVWGQRFDLYPRLTYSAGSDVILTQSLGLRETAYSLHESDGFSNSLHRESFDYTILAYTRLMKSYGSFTHIVEPSIGYTFIPSVTSNLPIFDSTELYTKTSSIQFSLMNRFRDTSGDFLVLRLTQAFDSYQDHPLQPLTIDASVLRPLNLRVQFSFDVNAGKVETVNSDLTIPLAKGSVYLAERYERNQDILSYVLGARYPFSKALSAEGSFWYDAKNGGFQNFAASVKYQQQCWGVTLVFTKRQSDYSFSVLFDLLGIGTIKL